MSRAKKMTVLAGSVALAIGMCTSALAQGPGSGVPAATTANGAAQPASVPLTKAERKAQHKAARKEAKAKNSAEIKRLKDAGYQPNQNDPNYPENLQKAERKAAAGQAASK
ncbi:DUF4148 domain-containing protein [Paraburkholderia sediminicola]|uniref:DUF4148 domain-containing protein n=1 Tax=Paraburkholderia rhynchosiae TaxID=487049 RepID=A0ACC7NBE4_9BURK